MKSEIPMPIAIIAVVVLLGIVAVGGYFMMNREPKPTSKPSQADVPMAPPSKN